MKKIMIALCMLLILFTGCTSGKENNNKIQSKAASAVNTFYSSDKAVSLSYDPKIWVACTFEMEKGKNQKGIKIDLKDSNTNICIICKEYSENITNENDYVNMLVNAYKQDEISGSTKVTKLKIDNCDFPLVHALKKDNNDTITYDTLVVMNGKKQYEFSYIANKDNYDKYKDAAMTVFKTMKIDKKDDKSETTKVSEENNPELAKKLKELDQKAGIDTQSVIDNVSKNGKEIIGSWGVKKEDGSIDPKIQFNGDGSYKYYMKDSDEKDTLSGTWSYDGNRLLKLKITKAIKNGKDIIFSINSSQDYEIYYFKDNTMRFRNINTLSEYQYVKAAN